MSTPVGDTWSLPALEHFSAIEQAHRVLRDAIVDGSISQGAHLREIHLAQTLGTSRGTVREAIRQLVQEGLAEYKLHRGTFVLALSPSDRLDVYVAREAIETGAARRILAAPAGDLSDLRAALEALRAVANDQDHVTDPVIDADIRFHQELVRLAASPRLMRAHDTLAAETRMLLRHHPDYSWSTYVTDHVRLLEAIERRDPATPDLVAEHLRLSKDLIASELAHEGEEPPMQHAPSPPDSPEAPRVV